MKKIAIDTVALDAIETHLEAFLGAKRYVFHEIVSDVVHIDLHIVPADEGREFLTVVTSGMSSLAGWH